MLYMTETYDIQSHINLPKVGIIIPTSQTETEIS